MPEVPDCTSTVTVQPEIALSDGKQALRPAEFAQLAAELRRLVPLVGKRWARGAAAGADLPTIDTFDDEAIAP